MWLYMHPRLDHIFSSNVLIVTLAIRSFFSHQLHGLLPHLFWRILQWISMLPARISIIIKILFQECIYNTWLKHFLIRLHNLPSDDKQSKTLENEEERLKNIFPILPNWNFRIRIRIVKLRIIHIHIRLKTQICAPFTYLLFIASNHELGRKDMLLKSEVGFIWLFRPIRFSVCWAENRCWSLHQAPCSYDLTYHTFFLIRISHIIRSNFKAIHPRQSPSLSINDAMLSLWF